MTEMEKELLTLLDLIETQEDSKLTEQRFAIAEKYGYTIEICEPISGMIN